MLNPNRQNLTKLHGSTEAAFKVWQELCDIGGFGSVDFNNIGGLDVAGMLREENTAIPAAVKDRIAELCGEKRIEEYTTTSSAAKMPKPKEN